MFSGSAGGEGATQEQAGLVDETLARNPRVIVISGPTASGKTELSLFVAKMLRGEVISADSMQVYEGMDIGTAKPTRDQRSVVPHHLIDILDPGQHFSVAEYVELAAVKVQEIRQRGHEVLFVGGTPLYLKAPRFSAMVLVA